MHDGDKIAIIQKIGILSRPYKEWRILGRSKVYKKEKKGEQ